MFFSFFGEKNWLTSEWVGACSLVLYLTRAIEQSEIDHEMIRAELLSMVGAWLLALYSNILKDTNI